MGGCRLPPRALYARRMRAAGLSCAVAHAIGADAVELDQVVSADLDYDAFLAHRHVRRLSGVAVTQAGAIPWSLIEKATGGSGVASDYLVDNGRRELAAYRSGLLADLPPGVRVPVLHGFQEFSDGGITLWLEDVRRSENALREATLVVIARDLGRLSGTWLGRAGLDPWLFRGWIDRHAQTGAQEAGRKTLLHPTSAARTRLGALVEVGVSLIDAQPRIAALLESLPQSVCHHDAVGANILRSDGATVLIDWESVGPGTVGADLASLLFSSVRRGDCSAAVVVRHFDAAVTAFVAGIRDTGAAVDPASVRLGVDAAIALRWKLIADLAAALDSGTPVRRGSAPDEPPTQALDELVALGGIMAAAAERVARE